MIMGAGRNQSEKTRFLTYFSFLYNLCFMYFCWKLRKLFFSKGNYSAWPFTLLWDFLSDNNPQTLQELKLSH